jgi:tRNA U34 5-methylaminomethyl-2-thiouridine-forming methyltransferase MnmC
MAYMAGLELTLDGSATVYSERYGEFFHNRFGAKTQARHVFLEGSMIRTHATWRVLEIGFGLGLNFLTTLQEANARGRALDYRAFEIDPQPRHLLEKIGRDEPAAADPLWQQLLLAWPADASRARLDLTRARHRLQVDFVDASSAPLPFSCVEAIYLDGFSPAVNPELWTSGFILGLAGSLAPGGWIATYSAAGAVRRAFAEAGLRIERCTGLAGKREWLRAQKPPPGLATP